MLFCAVIYGYGPLPRQRARRFGAESDKNRIYMFSFCFCDKFSYTFALYKLLIAVLHVKYVFSRIISRYDITLEQWALIIFL